MLRKFFIIGATVILSGCISAKSYVDPGFKGASYSDIRTPTNKYSLNINVEFQRNGEHLPGADNELRGHVERTLRATGIALPEFKGGDTTLKVVVNNIADRTAAAAKGAGTGLTFGAVGSTVTDSYDIKISLISNGKEVNSNYMHVLHTTVGNASAPFPNVNPTSAADAFGKIIEQVLVKFVKDMQSQNMLVQL